MLSEDEALKIRTEVLENLKLPYIWQRISILKDGRKMEVHIRDLQEKQYKKALVFLQEHYLTKDYLCEVLKISSCPRCSSGLLNLILTWMKDEISLEAVVKGEIETQEETCLESSQYSSANTKSDNTEEEIVGLLVCRVSHRLEHSRTFSRFRIPMMEMDQATPKVENELSDKSETLVENNVSHETHQDMWKLQQYIRIRSHMAKLIDIYEHYDIDKYLQINVLNVHSEWMSTDLSEYLMRAAFQQATQLNVSVAMGIIASENEQKLAKKVGMTDLARFCYSEWDGGSLVDVAPNNDSALVMVKKIKNRKVKKSNLTEI